MARNASIKAAKKKLATTSKSPPKLRKGRVGLQPPIAESNILEPASPSPTKKSARISSTAATEPSPSGAHQAGRKRDTSARTRQGGSSPRKSAATKGKGMSSLESKHEVDSEHSAQKPLRIKRAPARRNKAIREVKERLENKGASDALAKWLQNKRLQEDRLRQRRMYGKVTVKPTLMCMPKPKTPPVCTEEAIMLMMAESSPISSKASPSKPAPKKVATSRRRGVSSLRTLKEESLSMEGMVEFNRIAPLESEVVPATRLHQPDRVLAGERHPEAALAGQLPALVRASPHSRQLQSRQSRGSRYSAQSSDSMGHSSNMENFPMHGARMGSLQPLDVAALDRFERMPGLSPNGSYQGDVFSPARSMYSSPEKASRGHAGVASTPMASASLAGNPPAPKLVQLQQGPRPAAMNSTHFQRGSSDALPPKPLGLIGLGPSGTAARLPDGRRSTHSTWEERDVALDADAETTTLNHIKQRELLLHKLAAMVHNADSSHDMDRQATIQLAKVWGMLQQCTLEVVEAIVAWQTRLPAHSPHMRTQRRPFIWNGQDYLLKVGPDMAFLEPDKLARQWLGGRSPAADPFAPMTSLTPHHPAPVCEADPLRVRMATTVLRRAKDRSAVDLVRASLVSPGAPLCIATSQQSSSALPPLSRESNSTSPGSYLYPLHEVDARMETQASSRSQFQESSLPGLMDMDSARESQLSTAEFKPERQSSKRELNLLLNNDVDEDSVQMTSPCSLIRPGGQTSKESNTTGRMQSSVDEQPNLSRLSEFERPQLRDDIFCGETFFRQAPEVGEDSTDFRESRDSFAEAREEGLKEEDLGLGREHGDPPQPLSSSDHAQDSSFADGPAPSADAGMIMSVGSCPTKAPLMQNSVATELAFANPAEDLANQEHVTDAVEGYGIANPVVGSADASKQSDDISQDETVEAPAPVFNSSDAETYPLHGLVNAVEVNSHGSEQDRGKTKVARCFSTAKPENDMSQPTILGALDSIGPTSCDHRKDFDTMLLSCKFGSGMNDDVEMSSAGPHITQAPVDTSYHAKQGPPSESPCDISACEVQSCNIQDSVEVEKSRVSQRHNNALGYSEGNGVKHEVQGGPAVGNKVALECEVDNHASVVEDTIERVMASLFEYAMEGVSEFKNEGASQASVSVIQEFPPRAGSRNQPHAGDTGTDLINDPPWQFVDPDEFTKLDHADQVSVVKFKLENEVDEALRDLLESIELAQDTGGKVHD